MLDEFVNVVYNSVMKMTEALNFLKELSDKYNIDIVPLSAFVLYFKNEAKESVVSELSRMVKNNLIVRVSPGLFLNPFHKKGTDDLLLELLRKIRPYDQLYLSLDARAYEIGMILQMPNRLTFVTDGRSYILNTPIGIIELNHQSIINIKEDKDLEFDEERGIYVASRKRVIADAKKHKRLYLLDLIDEQNKDMNKYFSENRGR